jgi:small conductance mechanosensitive channel
MATASSAFKGLQTFMERLTPYMNTFVVFFIILFLGFLVGKILGRLVKRILSDVHTDTFLRQRFGVKFSVERLVSGLITSVAYLVSIVFALNALHLTFWVAGAITTILMLAVTVSALIALKDLIPNAAAGVALRRRLSAGSYVRMEGGEGVVKEVNLLDTVIETRTQDVLIVPNALFAKKSLRILKRKPAAKAEVTRP